mgnify:CR=1 FL=1
MNNPAENISIAIPTNFSVFIKKYLVGFKYTIKNENTFIHPRKKELGTYSDWIRTCQKLKKIPKSNEEAKSFFENEFKFIQHTQFKNNGTLTGYYEPIIDVRKTKNNIYSEPILKLPINEEYQKLNPDPFFSSAPGADEGGARPRF